MRLLSHSETYSSWWTSGGILARRLFRRFEDGELDALRAKGEGLLGGPPTTSKSEGAGALKLLLLVLPDVGGAGKPALLEARELRLSFGGGMGDGALMVVVECGEGRGRRGGVEVEVRTR